MLEMKRRGHLEICINILCALKSNGSKQTHIIYKTNINQKLFKIYIVFLNSHGLVEKQGKLWFLTDRGKEALRHFNDLTKTITLE